MKQRGFISANSRRILTEEAGLAARKGGTRVGSALCAVDPETLRVQEAKAFSNLYSVPIATWVI